MDQMQGAWPTLSGMTAFADVVVTGTVEGFTVGQMRSPGARPPTTAKALTSVVMRVRVDKTINGSAPGTQIYVRVGSGSDAALQKFQTAIPAGARLVAFLDQLPSPLGDGGDGTGHPAGTPLMDQQQGLIFEDQGTTGTTLVGGPYQSKHLDKPWTQATTMDQLVPLLQTDLQTLTDDCAKLDARLRAKPPATMAKPGDLSLMRLRCYRLRPSGATPTPSP
jgi:hypothetical protein